jgi:hypothetical protein
MGKFSPTKLNGDCEEVANPSTAYGRRRRNWIDAHGAELKEGTSLQEAEKIARLLRQGVRAVSYTSFTR